MKEKAMGLGKWEKEGQPLSNLETWEFSDEFFE